MRILSAAFVASSLISFGSSAHAATLLSENFDAENGGVSALNYASFGQFNLSGGTVDLIASGDFGISCTGGTGACVDLDGSTNDSGRMTSNAFLLTAGQDITLSFAVSGNQRGGSSDTVTFGILLDGSVEFTASKRVAPFDPFGTVSVTLTNILAGSYSIFFENSGGDNVGAILDDVTWTTDGNISVVPVPATAPMLLVGLGAIVVAARRRKR
jgi:hypothetical protein